MSQKIAVIMILVLRHNAACCIYLINTIQESKNHCIEEIYSFFVVSNVITESFGHSIPGQYKNQSRCLNKKIVQDDIHNLWQSRNISMSSRFKQEI